MTMKERPILYSGPMVRALLARTKTQTRRVMKPQPAHGGLLRGGWHWSKGAWNYPIDERQGTRRALAEASPYFADRLWVRETWGLIRAWNDGEIDDWDGKGFPKERPAGWVTPFAADEHPSHIEDRGFRWRPSIHMPRWASRISLDVTDIRVERLQDISEEDAKAEGAEWHDGGGIGHSGWRHDRNDGYVWPTARDSFFRLWSAINGAESLAANPWVWAVEFKRAD